MTSNEARTLQELGTRLEWAYPAERDPALLAIIAPLFPWADSDGAPPARKRPDGGRSLSKSWCRLQDSNL